jgi:hypothetical protein
MGSVPHKAFVFLQFTISRRTVALELAQPLTEMSTRGRKIKFLASKVRLVRRADDFTAICEPIV